VAVPVGMPKLGMTMTEGKVVAWTRAVGEPVEKGAPIVVIESEKSEVEIEAAASGVLRHVWVEAGTTVPCGTLLGAIAASMDEPLDVGAFRREHDRPEVPAPASPAAPRPVARERIAIRTGGPVTPAARAATKALGVDPTRVPGTGPGGRVTREDVEAFAAAGAGPVRLEVLVEGQGDPIVLLPGFASDVSVFAPETPPLVRRARVLAVNPRGVGASTATLEAAYTVADAAADVAALLDAPADVVGASLGAATAIELALAHPEKVRRIVLITPFVTATPRLLAVTDAWSRLAADTMPELVARAVVPWLFSSRTLGDPAAVERTVRGLVAMQRRTPAATLARQAAGLRAWSGSRAGELARIDRPTLVVTATEDLLTPDGAAVARAIPGATLVEIAGAGHAVTLEAPDRVNAVLAEHLRS
jgi:pyruvate dehydrogenase E2 component (dihydrolipoamide acetyltransferase)